MMGAYEHLLAKIYNLIISTRWKRVPLVVSWGVLGDSIDATGVFKGINSWIIFWNHRGEMQLRVLGTSIVGEETNQPRYGFV